MKTIQLNFEPPYLSILLQSLHNAFDAEAQALARKKEPESIEVVNICGIVNMHFEIKETIKRELPQLYDLLKNDNGFKKYDELFKGMRVESFYKKSMKHIELMSKKTKMDLKKTN